jgi:fructose-bisphosphate aldolase class II
MLSADMRPRTTTGFAAFTQQYGTDPGIMKAAEETDSPVTVQASRGARAYTNDNYLRHLMLAAAELHPDFRSACNRTTAHRRDLSQRDQELLSRPEYGRFALGDGKTPFANEYNVKTTL